MSSNKNTVQEMLVSMGYPLPTYERIKGNTKGLEFVSIIHYMYNQTKYGVGGSKKNADFDAAKKAIKHIELMQIGKEPYPDFISESTEDVMSGRKSSKELRPIAMEPKIFAEPKTSLLNPLSLYSRPLTPHKPLIFTKPVPVDKKIKYDQITIWVDCENKQDPTVKDLEKKYPGVCKVIMITSNRHHLADHDDIITVKTAHRDGADMAIVMMLTKTLVAEHLTPYKNFLHIILTADHFGAAIEDIISSDFLGIGGKLINTPRKKELFDTIENILW